LNLDSGSKMTWGGAIYLPNARLQLNSGTGVGAFGMIYADSFVLDSGASISLSCSYMPGGKCPSGGGVNALGGAATIALAE
jgi:hypothetical protein